MKKLLALLVAVAALCAFFEAIYHVQAQNGGVIYSGTSIPSNAYDQIAPARIDVPSFTGTAAPPNLPASPCPAFYFSCPSQQIATGTYPIISGTSITTGTNFVTVTGTATLYYKMTGTTGTSGWTSLTSTNGATIVQ